LSVCRFQYRLFGRSNRSGWALESVAGRISRWYLFCRKRVSGSVCICVASRQRFTARCRFFPPPSGEV
jgi:hypothetical protein